MKTQLTALSRWLCPAHLWRSSDFPLCRCICFFFQIAHSNSIV